MKEDSKNAMKQHAQEDIFILGRNNMEVKNVNLKMDQLMIVIMYVQRIVFISMALVKKELISLILMNAIKRKMFPQ